jgi:hypothetical protein
MSKHDSVESYLTERGCPAAVIAGGFAGLIEQWEALVTAVEEGYELELDDYLNEVDVRQLLADAQANAPREETSSLAEPLQRADEQFQALTQATEACLWGEEVAEEEGWSAKNNFWYYRRPRRGDADFLAEIREALGEYE